MKTFFLRLFSVLLLALLLPAGQGTRPVYAASYVVDSLGDTIANDGRCTLREAIQEANNGANTDCPGSPSSADDIITFAVSGTITLTSTLPTIVSAATAGKLTIDGGNAITISGNNTVSVLWVGSGGNLTLQNITIANGAVSSPYSGGGVLNFGTLTATNCTFSNNNGGYQGGAIYSKGATALTVTNCTFAGNQSASEGGAISCEDTPCTITSSTFSGNRAGRGGAIASIWYFGSQPSLNITGSTFEGNQASGGGGGALYLYGVRATITGSIFNNNAATATWGQGGAIHNWGDLTVTGSQFSQNTAKNSGAIWCTGSRCDISESTFVRNSASSSGGALGIQSMSTITRSTFLENQAGDSGGAIFRFTPGDPVIVANSTFANNRANSAGGGIASSGTMTITNSTFSGNSAPSGGGLRVFGNPPTLQNTIIANSPSGGDCVGTLSGSNINNLIEDSTNACGLVDGVNGNIIGQDPNLGPLTGSPAYFPLSPGSPAIDTGDNATCAAPPVNNQSQNSVLRPQNGDNTGSAICDIGSYEHPDTLPPALLSFTRFNPATSPTNVDTLIFRATFNEDVQNVDATDFVVDSTSTATIVSVTQVSPSLYEVTVSGGDLATYNGTVGLNLAGGQDIKDLANNPLPNSEPATDEIYTVDHTAPIVVYITRADPNPTNAASVRFIVTFSENVTGVDTSDFSLTTSGSISGASVTSVSGSGTTYTVTVNTGSGNGTIRLDVPSGATITDLAGNLLSGLPFTSGQAYDVQRNYFFIFLPLIAK